MVQLSEWFRQDDVSFITPESRQMLFGKRSEFLKTIIQIRHVDHNLLVECYEAHEVHTLTNPITDAAGIPLHCMLSCGFDAASRWHFEDFFISKPLF